MMEVAMMEVAEGERHKGVATRAFVNVSSQRASVENPWNDQFFRYASISPNHNA
jgi:hypothetical protein